MKMKADKETDKLFKHHFVATSKEFHQLMMEIDDQQVSMTKKKAQKLSLLRTQIKIRKIFLGKKLRLYLLIWENNEL